MNKWHTISDSNWRNFLPLSILREIICLFGRHYWVMEVKKDGRVFWICDMCCEISYKKQTKVRGVRDYSLHPKDIK